MLTEAQETIAKPRKVSIAIGLLLINTGVSYIYTLTTGIIKTLNHEYKDALQSEALQIVVMILLSTLFLLIPLFFIGRANAGNNGARILFLVLFAVGLLSYLTGIGHFVSGTVKVINLVLNAVAILLLYTKESNDWFKSMKTKR